MRVLHKIRRKWHLVGLELGLDGEELENIKSQHKPNLTECLNEMILLWLKSINPVPTWKALVEALKATTVGEAQLAQEGRVL